MPDIRLFFHDIGNFETCNENILVTVDLATSKTGGCCILRELAVLLLNDQCNWVPGLCQVFEVAEMN